MMVMRAFRILVVENAVVQTLDTRQSTLSWKGGLYDRDFVAKLQLYDVGRDYD